MPNFTLSYLQHDDKSMVLR